MPKKDIEGKKVPVPALKLKYKDVFDIKDFYKALYEWLLEHDWRDVEEGNDHWESYYGERGLPGGSKEIWIWWRVFKPVPDAPYLNYYMDINMHALGIAPTEVIKDGVKIKAQKGEIEIRINGLLELLYTSKFKHNVVLRKLQSTFTKRIYTAQVEREKELYQELHSFYNFIKQWFKLKRYLPYEESKGFFPSKAWPSHQK